MENNVKKTDYYAEMAFVKPGQETISNRAFNGIVGAVILYGFIIDACIAFGTKYYLSHMEYAALESFARNYGLIIKGLLVGYLFCVFIGARLIENDKPFFSFLGFNLYAIPVGILMSIGILPYYPMDVVISALTLTAILSAAMLGLSWIWPDAFLNMGRALTMTAGTAIIIDLIAVFIFRINLESIDFILTIVFALFIGYDWAKASRCAKTVDHAIDCGALLYMNIINVFLRLLSLMGSKKK